MSIKYDGDFTTASAVTAKRVSYPFNGDRVTFGYEQDFMQLLANFSALALNTTDAGGLYLVDEMPVQDQGGGIARWTRVYSKVPVQRNEYESFAYEFPGYLEGNTGAGNTAGRDPVTYIVTSRLQYDYYLVGSGGSYASASLIPIIQGQRYWGIGGVNYPVTGKILGNASTPTKDQWVANVNNGTEIVAEDSSLKRWRGNIYERVTRYIKAQ